MDGCSTGLLVVLVEPGGKTQICQHTIARFTDRKPTPQAVRFIRQERFGRSYYRNLPIKSNAEPGVTHAHTKKPHTKPNLTDWQKCNVPFSPHPTLS